MHLRNSHPRSVDLYDETLQSRNYFIIKLLQETVRVGFCATNTMRFVTNQTLEDILLCVLVPLLFHLQRLEYLLATPVMPLRLERLLGVVVTFSLGASFVERLVGCQPYSPACYLIILIESGFLLLW